VTCCLPRDEPPVIVELKLRFNLHCCYRASTVSRSASASISGAETVAPQSRRGIPKPRVRAYAAVSGLACW